VFTGLDLAFTGGRTYCRGTAHEEIWGKWIEAGDTWDNVWAFLVSQQPQQTLPDCQGLPALTTPYLVAFRNWLVDQIGAAPQPRTFVNASGGGILYGPRIELASLADALGGRARISAESIQTVLASAHQTRLQPPGALHVAAREVARSLSHATASPLEGRWRKFTAGALDPSQTSKILIAAAESLQP
jgi:hypothetical protein